MPIELNLPRLRNDHRVQSPAGHGVWSSPGELNDLSAALAVEADAMPLREIKSVPHTWGHVIVFESALRSEKHPGHEDAGEQWRALLALLALRNRPGFSVNAVAVRLDRAEGREGLGQAFARVLGQEKLAPKIGDEPTWDTVHLLYAQVGDRSDDDAQVLVGMLSPSTIVAPVRDFAGDGRLSQFWARDRLRDPLARDGGELSPDDLYVCRQFAAHLRDAIRDREVPAGARAVNNTANTLAARLESFLSDLDDAGARHHISTWTQRHLGDLVVSNPAGVYTAVNSVWEEEERDDETTDLKLGEIRLDDETAVRVVLADRGCADTLRLQPQHVSLFGHRTLADLPETEDEHTPAGIRKRRQLREEAAEKGFLLLGPSDLLSDCLTRLEEFDSEHHPRKFHDSLLPVNPVALLLLPSLADLRERLDLLGSADRPRVELRLTVTSEGRPDRPNQTHEHSVTRVYGDGEPGALKNAYAPEALAAWPDFHASGWKWNYLFSRTNVSRSPAERSAILTTGVSRTILLKNLERSGGGAGAASVNYCRRRLERWGSARGPWNSATGCEKEEGEAAWFEWLRMGDEGGRNPQETSLQRSDTVLDAALFRLPSKDGSSVYAGLGILAPAREVRMQDAAAGGTAEIACDFGTSNTIVYCKRGNGNAKPLPFTPRLRRFNHYRELESNASADKEDEYAAFMPIRTVEQPFTTVMQLRSADGGEDLVDEWKKAGEPALWRDYAFFDPNVRNLTESLLSGKGSANLVFDLKWGMEHKDRRRMARYLRHINILSLAEVMGHRDLAAPSSVGWHFSYPISRSDADAYRRVIESDALDAQDRRNGITFHTESHAALDYFRGVDPAETQATLVLDIGGGSTDIALATRRSEAVWQSSVRLAGDDLMTEFLLYNRDFLEDLELARFDRAGVFGDEESMREFMNPPDDQLPGDRDRNAARAIINSPVFGTAFEKQWAFVMGTKSARRLKAGAWVMMGGLCRYLMRQIQALLRDHGEGLVEEDLTTIRLCFGGRGSTLFKVWDNDDDFMRLAARLTDYAADSPDEHRRGSVTTYFSRDMKHEAAKGMLAGSGGIRTPFRIRDGDFNVLGIGANLGDDVDATRSLGEIKRWRDANITPAVSWEEFVSFVQSVGGECGFEVRIHDVARDDIATDGREAFQDLLRDAKGAEPPFIAMLRKTMRLIYQGKSIEIDWDGP